MPGKYGNLGRWVLGLCLIISALLSPEIGLHIIGYLADLLLGQIVPGLLGVIWLLMMIAGVGLIAARRWACLLVYVAALYTLVPNVSGFSFFPFVPLLTTWLGIKGIAGLVVIHATNVVFVVMVGGVHVWLSRTAYGCSPESVRVCRRVSLGALSLGGLSVLVSGAGLLALFLDLQWHLIMDAADTRTIVAFLLIVGAPLIVLGLPGYVISHRRLKSSDGMRSEAQKDRKLHWCQLGLRPLLLLVLVVSVLVSASVAIWHDMKDPSRYNRHFHRVIAQADRIVVRDGGFDCCGPVDDEETLFEEIDPREVEKLRQKIQFVEERPAGACMCCGYPGIDWYCGERRLALTSVQHGYAIRWKGFPGDACLTEESSKWLREWLVRHGLSKECLD